MWSSHYISFERLGTSRFQITVPDFQISCCDLTKERVYLFSNSENDHQGDMRYCITHCCIIVISFMCQASSGGPSEYSLLRRFKIIRWIVLKKPRPVFVYLFFVVIMPWHWNIYTLKEQSVVLSTLRLEQDGWHFADNISNAFSWMKIVFRFHRSWFVRVQITMSSLVQAITWTNDDLVCRHMLHSASVC